MKRENPTAAAVGFFKSARETDREMALVRKKKQRTPEEQLEAARVPREEWPYELPEGWTWVRLDGVLSDLQYGYTAKAIEDTSYPKFLRITDIQDGQVNWEQVPYCVIDEDAVEKYKIEDGDIFFARIGATTGKSFMIRGKVPMSVFASYLIRVRVTKVVDRRYVYAFFQSPHYWYQISVGAAGIAQPGVNANKLGKLLLPLPPLAEQHRIVQRIESLFAKLDEAEEKLDAAEALFVTRKAALLRDAYSGSLTKKWREINQESLEDWKTLPLKDCGTWFGGGTPNKAHPEYWEAGTIPWITSKDVKTDIIEDTQIHINWEGVENSSAKFIKSPALIFVMRSGILRHSFPVAISMGNFTVNQDLKGILPNEKILLKYLLYAMQANEKNILGCCMKNGITVESINADELRVYELKIPPLDEQREIVRILDRLLARERRAKEAVAAARTHLKKLRASILARAFRGEL